MADDADVELRQDALGRALVRPPCILGAAAMLAAAKLQTDFLVQSRIPLGAITLITGEPGAKKSWLAYSLAISTARGGPWLGFACRSGPVLVLNYDNSRAECGRRFMRLGMRPSDPIYFHAVEGPAALRLPAAAEELGAIVAHIKPALIVDDSMRQSHTADENSSKEMAQVMGHLKAWYRFGAAIVAVHHSAKGDGAPSRGSGEIDASTDVLIHATAGEATWKKHRSWNLEPVDEVLGFSVDDIGDNTEVSRVAPKPPKPKREGRPYGA